MPPTFEVFSHLVCTLTCRECTEDLSRVHGTQSCNEPDKENETTYTRLHNLVSDLAGSARSCGGIRRGYSSTGWVGTVPGTWCGCFVKFKP